MEKFYKLFLECDGVSTDTRTVNENQMFFCLKGANFNGNQFAIDAAKKGAKYIIIDEAKYNIEGKTILVDNVLETLQKLANFHRNKLNIPIIGITGSNGKTTTKELIHHLLSQQFNVLATKGNLNNHIGVPLTLLHIKHDHQIAIIEMGANHPEDIKELCEIAKPNFGIITNIGKAHLEGFKNLEGVIKAKTALYKSVQKSNGTIFINSDDSILTSNIAQETTKIFYSSKDESKVYVKGNLLQLNPFIKLKWEIESYISPELQTKIIGEYNYYNLLASITIANYFGVPYSKINTGITTYTNENNRSQIKETKDNQLIMDAYNANPSSMSSAINSFRKVSHKNKTMILGDMFELGDESKAEHQNIIELALKTDIRTYFVGERFWQCEIKNNNLLLFFQNKEELINYLKSSEHKLKNNLILLKGSRGVSLETITEYL